MKGWQRRLSFALFGLTLGMGISTLVHAHSGERPGGGSSFRGGGGGGSSFGGGGGGGGFSSSSYSSSSYSGGGGGGDIGVFGLVIMVGMGVVFATISMANQANDDDGWSSSSGTDDFGQWQPQTSFKPVPVKLAPLRRHDPNFSQILLEDFLYELYTRAMEARGSKEELALLSPYLDPKVRNKLRTRGNRAPLAISGVIVGAMRVSKFEMKQDWASIEVIYETNYTEAYPADQDKGRLGFYAKERWHFVRMLSVQSRKPDETRGFNCPACGAPVEESENDECSHCGTTHGVGDVDWLCNGIELVREETRGPALTGYAEEVGTFDPSVVDDRLQSELVSLREHDSEFDDQQFFARAKMIYHELNAAWSSLDWDDARPYLSDRLWYSMRYWIHAYEEQSLQNLMLGAKIDRIEMVKVATDPFFHAITIRLWASALDHTIHRGSGAVVGGNASLPRDYSEYWTFIRSAERRGSASTDKNCPNCGAALELNMAGNCEHCGVKITAGQFDWVLSKIEQDEAYQG
ncbi:MAG: TIM44-like domain-containing protein [Myxococcota bacterium]